MSTILDVLLCRTWWAYPPIDDPLWGTVYHWFNLLEGVAWFACAGYVTARYWQHRRSLLEAWYALAFLVFGCTDFWEAHQLTSWLLWLKLANLIILYRLRAIVIKRFYPGTKML